MAERHIIERIDDISGETGEGVEKFYFVTVAGVVVSIDLDEANAKALVESMQKFADAGRREGKINLEKWLGSNTGTPTPSSSVSSTGRVYGSQVERRHYLQNVREWARKRGMRVSERGRIPEDILTAYEQEHAA